MKRRETDRVTDRRRTKLRRRAQNGKEDVKKEKRLFRSLLLTILERSVVARATSGTVIGIWSSALVDVRLTSGLHKYLASLFPFS